MIKCQADFFFPGRYYVLHARTLSNSYVSKVIKFSRGRLPDCVPNTVNDCFVSNPLCLSLSNYRNGNNATHPNL